MQKRILCFGDSNTYGNRPTGGRYGEDIRYPMRLASLLGEEYTVLEEGFGGRTTVFDDPVEGGYKSGADYLPPCLMSHNPLHAVVIMLGTNDTKKRFGMSPTTIAAAIMRLIRLTRDYGADEDGRPCRVLLVSPPPIGDWLMQTHFAHHFGEEAIEISRGLAAEYARIARLMRCDFLDAGLYAQPSREDAVHLSAQGHLQLAAALETKLREMLEK